MENIILFSDGHGSLPNIPKKFRNGETVVIFAGDQCDNYTQNFQPCIRSRDGQISPCGWRDPWNYRKIDKVAEAKLQYEWIKSIFIPHLQKQDIDLKRVVWINGNHDFVDASDLFLHSCFNSAKTISIDGIKIGLLVGCLPLVFEWHEEIEEPEIANRIQLIDPTIEILVSHSPCYSVKDKAHGDPHIGSQELYTAIFGKSLFDVQLPYFTDLRFHLFGHAHGYPNVGCEKHEINGRTVKFVNSAENRIELFYPTP